MLILFKFQVERIVIITVEMLLIDLLPTNHELIYNSL